MPSFLYTIILISIGLWFGLIKYWSGTEPSGIRNILFSLFIFFLTISFTLSIPLFFYFKKRYKNIVVQRHVFRKSLRVSFILSIGITSFMALNAFELINLLTVVLFYIPYLLILWQELKRR